jgi:DNA-binding response OmpR family regulator
MNPTGLHASASPRARALEAGVIGYLTKPFNKNDLLACMRSALDLG